MILAIDVGNANIVLGVIDGKKIVFQGTVQTDTTKTSDEYCISLKTILDLSGVQLEKIEGAIISSVVPQVLNAMKSAILKLTGKTPLVVGPGLKTGLKIHIENPSHVGSDLVVGCVAALREHSAPLIVIDMGAATTMTVVDKDGAMVGGSIIPGVNLSMEALTQRTALLPGLQLGQPKKAIGRNTADCMRSGIMLGAACMIDGMIERIEEELGYTTTVVATGGIAKHILPLCRRTILQDNDLLLKGLSALYWDNI